MIFSRQFRALGRIAAAFAGAWAVIGGLIAILTGSSASDGGLLGWVINHMLMYGALGAISGFVTALLVAEAGRRVERLTTRRVALWGVVGGLAPVALFGTLGLVFGASASALLSLGALAIVSAGLGGAIAASSAAVAKRGEISKPRTTPRLPALLILLTLPVGLTAQRPAPTSWTKTSYSPWTGRNSSPSRTLTGTADLDTKEK